MNITRREALKKIGIGTLALVGGNIVTSKLSPFQLAYASEDEKWKQFAGSKLVFWTENAPHNLVIKTKSNLFKELTGIDIEITDDHIDILIEKVKTANRNKQGDFILYYSQDKPIGAPFFDFAEDLRKFENDPTLPKIPGGVDDDVWEYRWLDVTGRFFGKDKIVAYPYDSAISIMIYRTDIFEKYSKQFEAEYGRPLEYTDETTWKDVLDICQFFKNAKFPDMKYGLFLHGKEGWLGQLDYQRFSYSHGQWMEWDFDDWFGCEKPGPCKWGDEQSIMTMSKYKEVMNNAHPDSMMHDCFDAHNAYIRGLVAMVPQYGELAALVEKPEQSKAAGGRTAYALCPKGEPSWIVNGGKAVNGTNFGIGGIAINRYIKPELQKAAYLFALWSTSHDTQYMILKEVGGTPTRKSVFELPDVKAAFNRKTAPMKNIPPVEMDKGVMVDKIPLMPNALTYEASLKGIRPPNIVVGPKIPNFNEYIRIICSEIHRCLSGIKTSEEACMSIKKKTDKLHGL